MAFAVLLEGLQAFTPDRIPIWMLHCTAGALVVATLVAEVFMRAPNLATGRTLLMTQLCRLFRPAWNSARAALLTVSGRAGIMGSDLARAVAPQSPATVGLLAQPIAVRVRTDSLLREQYPLEAGTQF